MPNHCHNRVTFYSDDTTAILKLHKIFLKGIETDDNTEPNDTVFGSFIPEPDCLKFHSLRKLAKSIHSVIQEVKSVSVQNSLLIKINHLEVDCVSNLLTLWMIGGITGVSKTGELSGMLTLWRSTTQICHTDSRSILKQRGHLPKKSVMLSESNTTTFL